jgi:hypothetical protein
VAFAPDAMNMPETQARPVASRRFAWVLLAVWFAYSGGVLAWLRLQDPLLDYCVAPRR